MDLEAAQALGTADWHKKADKLKVETGCFIDGDFRPAKDGAVFESINPATGGVIAEVARGQADDIDAAVASCRAAFKSGVWSRMEPRDRMDVLYRYGQLINEHGGEFAVIDTLDMGKPVNDMLTVDVPFSALTFQYFGETIDKIEGTVTNTAADALHYILRQPLGVVGCIVPWNYPLMMAAWKIAPALAAGNTVVLKPAEQSPLSAGLDSGSPAGSLAGSRAGSRAGRSASAARSQHSGRPSASRAKRPSSGAPGSRITSQAALVVRSRESRSTLPALRSSWTRASTNSPSLPGRMPSHSSAIAE